MSISSVPLKLLNGLGIFLDLLLFKVRLRALYKVCKTKVDLPLPETPVTHVNVPRGIFRSTFFKLLPEAPVISKYLPFLAILRFFGKGINFLFDNY